MEGTTQTDTHLSLLLLLVPGVAVRGRRAGSPSLLRQAGRAQPMSASVPGGAPDQHRGQLPGLPPQHRPGGPLLRGGHHQPPAPRQVGAAEIKYVKPNTNTLRNLHAVSVTDGGAILTWGPGSNGDSDDEEVSVIMASVFVIFTNIFCSGQETCNHSKCPV